MRRGNEVGNRVMPSLEAAGNNIFQYFLVRLPLPAMQGYQEVYFGCEVLEYLQ